MSEYGRILWWWCGRRKNFLLGVASRGFSQIFFQVGAKSGEICFLPLEMEKTTLFCYLFQNPGGTKAPLPTPMSEYDLLLEELL